MNKMLLHDIHVIGIAAKRLMIENHFQRAASLSYTTLLSIVPLLSVLVSLLTIFPIFDQLIQLAQGYIEENFIPGSNGVIESELQNFVLHATQLPIVSILSLIVTSILLMVTVENALDNICQTTNKKRQWRRIIIYWLVLMATPILIGLGLLLSSYLFSLSWFSGIADKFNIKIYLLACSPLLINTIILTFLYRVVLIDKVDWHENIFGGFMAALLFEVAKHGFGLYIKHFSDYQVIYGAIAIIPIFLLWIYLSWLIILYGMLIVHTGKVMNE